MDWTQRRSQQGRTFGAPRIGAAIAAALALGLANLAGCAGGGGGGGGGGIVDEPAPPFPSVVRYSAGSPDFTGSGVTIALAGRGSARLAFYLEGSYAKGTRAYTLEPHSVARINVTTDSLPYDLLYDPFGILVEQTVQWVRGRHPTAGQVRTVPGGTVRLTVTADAGGTGQPGVDIAWIDADDDLGAASLTWSQLDGVLDDPAAWDDYVVQAAFVYQALVWVYDQVQLGMDGIEFVTVHDAALVDAGDGVGIDHGCPFFPFAGAAGSLHFTWNDGPGSVAGALGPDDAFSAAYADCWVNEPGAADLWVRSGTADLLGYWEDPDTITLGFDPMVLNAVVETATRQSGATHTLGRTVTAGSFGVNGQAGFRLLTVPDTSAGINVANATDVASAAVAALLLPTQVGDLGLGLLAGLVDDPSFDFCDLGGTVDVAPAPTAATAVPAAFGVTFTACKRDPADPSTLDGTATVNVEAVTGDTLAALATDDHAAALTVDAIDVTTTDALGPSTLTGGTHLDRTVAAGDRTDVNTSVAGGLSVTEDGVTRLLQAYQVTFARVAGGAYTLGAAGDAMAIVSDALGGGVTVTFVQPVQGTDPAAPVSGVLKVVALDGSTLTVTVDHGAVTLGVDTDGDGTVDDTLPATWDELT